MSIEDFLKNSADNAIINEYLRLLAERQLNNEQISHELKKCQLKIEHQERQIKQLENHVKNINTELDLLRRQSKVTETQINQFIVRDDGTVFDTKTGLTWCRYSIGQKWKNGEGVGDVLLMDWQEAMNIADSFNQYDVCGGFKDWRLPSFEELKSIVEKNQSPSINQTAFPNTPKKSYWTSSSYIYNTSAMFVNFALGNGSNDHKKSYHAVRLVR